MKTLSLLGIVSLLAAPLTVVGQTTVFQDTFQSGALSALNPTAAAPGVVTSTNTAYEIGSSKNATTTTVAAGALTLSTSATSSGYTEAQALFTANPVTLDTAGEYIDLYFTFTDTANTFNGTAKDNSEINLGLFNSGGGSAPTNGTALWNAGLVNTATTATNGACAGWIGYNAQMAYNVTGANSSAIGARPAQTQLNNSCQGLGYNSGYSSGANVATMTGIAGQPLLTVGNQYTMDLRITYVNATTLAITNTLYNGAGTGGTVVSSGGWTGQFGGKTTSANTMTFDGLVVGYRPGTTSGATTVPVNNITVTKYIYAAPSITGLTNQTIAEGEVATLSAAVSGTPAPALQWYVSTDGGATSNAISGQTSSILTLSGVSLSQDGYEYSLVASNSLGTAASSMTLSVVPGSNIAPTITGLTNRTVDARFNVTLAPTVSGAPTPAYQWSVNGTPIPGATSASLTLTNVQLWQNGYVYSLTATNTSGTVTSNMTLTVTSALFNVQLNGLGTTYSGAGQIGSAGDVWNNPALANFDNSGTLYSTNTPIIASASLVDSLGAASPVTLSLTGQNFKSYLNASSGHGEVAGLNNQSMKFDYSGSGTPSGTITLAGLPPSTSLNLYGYGSTYYTSPDGSYWSFAAANGGAGANQACTNSSGGMDLTQATNQGSCWIKIVGTTDSGGNLTVNLAPQNISGGVWWQFYLSGLQIQLHTAPLVSGLTNTTVVQGNSVTLTPTVTGTPAPTFQWQVNGTSIAGETNSSLTLNNVQYNQNGYVYSLVSSNQAGMVTNSMTLSVIVTPSIAGLNNQAVLTGSTVAISPTVSGVPAPSLQWQYNGVNLTDGATGNGSTVAGSTSGTLYITNAQPADSGTYSLVASNSAGIVTNSMSLTIGSGDVAPIVTGPTDQTVIQGSNATFTASVSGLPVPTVQWLVNGTPIDSASSSTLVLTNVQYSQNNYTYSLVASNNVGIVTNSATLTVLVPVTITAQPTNLVVTNTQSATFTVTADGVPVPAYQWYYNGSAIPSATTASYNIASAVPANMGNYQVVLSNSVNVVTSSVATLTVNSTMSFTSLTPANGATGVCYDTPLYVNFTAAPILRPVGKISIYNVTNPATPVDTIDLSKCVTNNATYAANVQPYTIGGTTFTNFPVIITGTRAAIYPHHGVLTSNQTYYVTMDNGVFTDSSGAYFAGISSTNAWQFTTKPTGPAVATNLVVAQDYSGDFATVQGALDSIPANNTTPTIINIHNGVYTEVVNVQSKHDITFRGQSRTGTVIAYPNNSWVYGNTHERMTFKINANNIALDNLTVTNSTPLGGSQAEALMIESGASSNIVNNCNIDSYQDTILANQNTSRVYFNNSLIQGNTDFIWGGGDLFFTNCEIRYLAVGSEGPNPSPSSSDINSNGFSFVNCRFTTTYGSGSSLIGRTRGITNANMVMITCLVSTNIGGWASDALPTGNFRNWYYNCTNDLGTSVTLSNGIALTTGDPNIALASSATAWLYGWQPQLTPNILTNPASQTVDSGSPGTFTVVATGIPNPTYQWMHAGTNLPDAISTTLAISSVTSDDAGDYAVVVTTAAGSVTSSAATLTVNEPANTAPVFTAPPAGTNITINVGVNLFVACSATDADTPAQTLTYSLLTGPSGAAVDAGTGNFTWRPTVAQSNSVNAVSVVVTDSGTPNLSATNNFTVTVNALMSPTTASPSFTDGQFSVNVGGQVGPDYYLQANTNLSGGTWTTVASTNSPVAMPVILTDPNAGSKPMQFYRIVAGPPAP